MLIFTAFLLGGMVHTAAGFGSALVSMPILTTAMVVQQATPMQAFVANVLSIVVLYQNRVGIQWRRALSMAVISLPGIPIGVYALTELPGEFVTAVLGCLLVGYAVFDVLYRRLHPPGVFEALPDRLDAWGAFAAFCAGILGGAYGANGPPLVIYAAVKRFPKESFRTLLQVCFLVNGIGIVTVLALRGLYTAEVAAGFPYALPGLFIGMVIGTRIDRVLAPERFRTLVLITITVLGFSLLYRSLV